MGVRVPRAWRAKVVEEAQECPSRPRVVSSDDEVTVLLVLLLACRSIEVPTPPPAVDTAPPPPVDSDGDGYTDAAEVEAGSDPFDASERPLAGGWHRAACRDAIESTGNRPGDIAEDFVLLDQHGELVHLHDFCDRLVVLLSGVGWQAPCINEARELEEWHAQYGDRGLLPVFLLSEALDREPAEPPDVTDFANEQELTYPVLADPGFAVTARFTDPVHVPSMTVIGPGAEILHVDTPVELVVLVDLLPEG